MKINNMTAKTSLEIEDTDILVIQDGVDTKHVTMAEFKEYMFTSGISKGTKTLINETLDNIAASILAAKYILSEEQSYRMNIWIGSASGNIQICLKDLTTDTWLTKVQLDALLIPVVEEIVQESKLEIKCMIEDVYQIAELFTIKDFNTEHVDAHSVNAELSDANAGFIKAHFEGLTQNQISKIIYSDIVLKLPSTEQYRYFFIGDPDSFANSVPYVTTI